MTDLATVDSEAIEGLAKTCRRAQSVLFIPGAVDTLCALWEAITRP